MKRWKFRIVVGVILSMLFVFSIRTFSYYEDRRILKATLGIESLPSSARSIFCQSGTDASDIQTDIVNTCMVEVEPIEFAELISGRPFVENRLLRPTPSRDILQWPFVSDRNLEFQVETTFEISKTSQSQIVQRILVVPSIRQDRAIVQFFEE